MPSGELSIPPDKDLIYDVLVVGWIHVSLSASICFENCKSISIVYLVLGISTCVLDRLGSSAGLKLEEDNMSDAHFRA